MTPGQPRGYCPSDALAEGDARAAGAFIASAFPGIFAVRRDAPASAAATGDAASLATRIAHAMLQAPGTRPLPPQPANLAALESRILRCVERGEPVIAEMLWSPKKHWVEGADSAIDLAELMAIDTLASFARAVQDVYAPGVAITLQMEDLEFAYMEGTSPALDEARERYIGGLRALARAVDDGIDVRAVSDYAADDAERARWHARIVENHRALAAYWAESEREGIARHDTLPSYGALRALGWVGEIPPEMRRYYTERLGHRAPADAAARVDMVVRNLATVLLHHQVGLGAGQHGSGAIKLSFVPPASGAHADLRNGRVNLRFASRRLSSRVSRAGPWSTKGFLRRRGDAWAFGVAGWRELAAAGARFVPGRFVVSSDGGEATVRADVLLEAAQGRAEPPDGARAGMPLAPWSAWSPN
jgi:hypothetical protein